MKYDIYVGLGGSFGGATYYDTYEFESQDEAEEFAYEQAVETYGSYEGIHGLKTFDDCVIEAEKYVFREDYPNESLYINALEECGAEIYNEEIERWIDYYAKEATDSEE